MRALGSHQRLHGAIQSNLIRSVDACIRLLTDATVKALPDDAIHGIRTRIKRMRTLIRLVRPALGERRYQRARRLLQQASRPLGRIRDARVALTVCRRLTRRGNTREAVRLRADLQRRLDQARSRASPARRRELALGLVALQHLIREWPQTRSDWQVLSRGLHDIYAGGRHALRGATATLSAQHLHELRKRAKNLLHTCEFLRKASPQARSMLPDLRRLARLLGTHHDFWLLRRTLAARDPPYGSALRRRLTESVTQHQRALRERIWEIGAHVYAVSPARLLKRVHRDWKSWR